MIIYLVRHGLSEANKSGLVTGVPSDRLVDQGIAQIEVLGNWLRDAHISPDAFYVSNWQRAHQTADILFPHAPWKEDSRLGETFAGTVAELPLHEFLAIWPDFYDSHANCYPGGESHLDLNNRVLSFWRELPQCGLSSIMLVSHSGPISCILQDVLGMGMERFPAFLPPQASLSVVESVGIGPKGQILFQLNSFALEPHANFKLRALG
jgi:broad specificity phosphatase PhoE